MIIASNTLQGGSMNFSFKAASFRRLEGPFDKEGRHCNIAVVEARDLPKELVDWRQVNLRTPNPRAHAAKEMRKTISEHPADFFFRNKGIVLMVQSVRHDNSTGLVSITLQDKQKHGLLDGGHTYNELVDAQDATEGEWNPVYVKLEILSGFTEIDDIVDIVEARNTGTAVSDESVYNLRGHYDAIAAILKDTPYANKIAYQQFQLDEEEERRPVPVKDILACLLCFDVDTFNEDVHPHRTYHSKSWVLKHFEENRERLERLLPLLADILTLRDTIYHQLPGLYNKQGGKFGSVDGVRSLRRIPETLHFTSQTSTYRIPDAYIYPVLAAFRTLVVKRGKRYLWTSDPIKMWENTRDKIAGKMLARVRDKDFKGNNKYGKEIANWEAMYNVVDRKVRRNAA